MTSRQTAMVTGVPVTKASTTRAAGLAGLMFAILTAASLLLIRDTPPRAESAFAHWWESYGPRYSIAMYLIPFAGIAFLWLLAALRHRIGRHEDQLFATVLLGSGLLYVAMFFAAGAAASAAAFATTDDGPAAYDAFLFGRAMSRAFFFVFATKMAAAFMLVASGIGRRTGVFPAWFTLVGLVAGIVLLLTITYFEPIALVFPAWVAILGMLLVRAQPPDPAPRAPG
jgi:hypothetical protein